MRKMHVVGVTASVLLDKFIQIYDDFCNGTLAVTQTFSNRACRNAYVRLMFSDLQPKIS